MVERRKHVLWILVQLPPCSIENAALCGHRRLLHELQDTILSKALWPKFQTRFANKETLGAKFGQLAGLRNEIRHSRSVDEITHKEGEAGIIWFERVLQKWMADANVDQ